MKQLVGVWEGASGMGKAAEKTRVEYRLTSGGSALVETLAAGNGEEMVTVYYDQKGKLAMTRSTGTGPPTRVVKPGTGLSTVSNRSAVSGSRGHVE